MFYNSRVISHTIARFKLEFSLARVHNPSFLNDSKSPPDLSSFTQLKIENIVSNNNFYILETCKVLQKYLIRCESFHPRDTTCSSACITPANLNKSTKHPKYTRNTYVQLCSKYLDSEKINVYREPSNLQTKKPTSVTVYPAPLVVR